ncbi:MAG TPA: ArgE/DapE family deacylase [Methanomicrobiales archaeon]|nr:ArgE/DapE family deacylase [Methanomicrobiales archaeon]
MDVARLCSDLVQIPSENPPGNTSEVIDYICGYLDALGIRSTLVRNSSGHDNLISVSSENNLLLCGHVDVVPAMSEGWSLDPFSGAIQDGAVWGRGASDMKGGCAAMLHALKTVIDAGIEPKANLAFVCDEETGGELGISDLLRRDLLPPSDCLIAEPTPPLSPVIGQKGLCRLHLEFSGVPGHGSLYPQIGTSAIMEAFGLLRHVDEIHQKEFAGPAGLDEILDSSAQVLEAVFGLEGLFSVLRRITYNPGKIEGGEKANIVAQHCTLELDMRVPFGCRVTDLIEDITRHAPRAEIRVMNAADPNFTPRDASIVHTLAGEVERVYQAPALPIIQWAASDAKYLRSAGFQVVEYGPGDLTTLHAVNEQVPIASLENAAEVYRGVITRYSQK